MDRNFLLRSTALCSLVFAIGVTDEAFAQLDEIIVTAQKREQTLADVPISLTVIKGTELTERGISNFEELAPLVPNFEVAFDTIRSFVSVRGVSTELNAGGEQSIGTFVDGIYRGLIEQVRFAFMDVERVEVLRGPQGTLFGKNTVGGAISVTAAKPTDEFEAVVNSTYEFRNEEIRVNGHLSGPISDKIGGRLAVMFKDLNEGWVTNSANPGKNPDSPRTEDWAIRGTLDFDDGPWYGFVRFEHGDFRQVGGSFEVDPNGSVGGFNFDGVQPISNAGDPILDLQRNFKIDGDTREVAAHVERDLGFGSVTALYGFSTYEFARDIDGDFSPFAINEFTEDQENDQHSIEVRFASDWEGPLSLIAGGFFQTYDFSAEQRTGIGTNTLSALTGGLVPAFGTLNRTATLDFTSDTYALFGQLAFDVTDQLTLTGGLRYSVESKEGQQSLFFTLPTDPFGGGRRLTAAGDPFLFGTISALTESVEHTFSDLTVDENQLAPQVQITYEPFEDVNLYGTWSIGYKSGGFDIFVPTANPDDAIFGREKATSWEIGAKTRLLDDSLAFNVAYFNSEFEDLQVTTFTGALSFITQNAAEATSQGIEADLTWTPQAIDGLTLAANGAWVDFEFETLLAACTAAQLGAHAAATGLAPGTTNAAACQSAGFNNVAGKSSAFTPEFSVGGSIQYERPIANGLSADFRFDASWKDDYFTSTDLDPNILQEGFVLIDVGVGVGAEDGSWRLGFLGKNLTDENYLTAGNDVPLLGGFFGVSQRPRTFAVQLSLRAGDFN